MPSFYKEVVSTSDQEMDVDVEEFLEECNQKEIKEVIQYLIDTDNIKSDDVIVEEEEISYCDFEFDRMVSKLSSLRLRLSLEDEETLRLILNKY